MGQQQRAALLALVGSLLVYVAALALFPATGDQDAALHALHSLFPLEASRLLSVWSRPLFAVPYVIPAWIGYPAMRLCTAAISALAAWITYLAARRAALPRPWIAIPLVLLQPCLFVPGVDTMTEPIFALVLAAGLWAFVDGRLLLTAEVMCGISK